MTRKSRHQPPAILAQADPEFTAPGEREVAFLKGAVGDGTSIIREGQHVSYELVQGADGLWYAVNIVVVDEPRLH
ncbi:hypothetical protein P5705_10265 [Pseudomonas entomophila]|uniref:hypothetical protein n=1 Tax=Pseudomonas entomophila TaxID=312306 RepID=UPI002406A4B3|nr:hypothetical protein [Pseudomonas entomophila]MDF9618027.1 hypothetical protein [Pseudomonas entomophila]